jgi:hypothetical protein
MGTRPTGAAIEEALRKSDNWLESRLLEDIPEGEFRFHTNRAVFAEDCDRVLEELRLSHLIAVNRSWI